jgi:translation initiation factor eIF-2B subunit epsilon
VIRSDPFILISGDVVSNLDLKKAIAYHKQKRKEDSNCVMTLVMKPLSNNTTSTSSIRPVVDDLVVGVDSNTQQLLLFEDALTNPTLSLPQGLLEENTIDLSIYTNLLDCQVDICSPELILQFSDNFDYQDVRRDFLRNESTNVALGKHLYVYMLADEYAARVQDARTYHGISRDLVTRWVYPLGPEGGQGLRYNYRDVGVKIARSAELVEGVVLGKHCEIAEHCVLQRSVIGAKVKLHNNVQIRESHIWEGVVVHSKAKITSSIICDNCIIGEGAVINRGCIVSYGVVIPPNTILPEYTRVYRKVSTFYIIILTHMV